jgi:hypothetical protein
MTAGGRERNSCVEPGPMRALFEGAALRLPLSIRDSAGQASTHFHRSVIHAGTEFESRMNALFASLPARIGDSGY